MRDTILRPIGMSAVYGLLIGGCLSALALMTSGDEFPLPQHKAFLFALFFVAGAAWYLLFWTARKLSAPVDHRG
jgi:hypothetical protein